jgi:2-polyprenyl-3-methyl-5-hydroxy-6-metoxy-1,4-benzoquinol methylase
VTLTQKGSVMVSWSLEQAYDAYPRIEQEFADQLGHSLAPRGPGQLLDLVADFGLEPGAAAIDVGCGEGGHAIALAGRSGLAVTGIDPVPRHIEDGQAAYDMMLGDCLWHIYGTIGKLERRVYVLSRPSGR